jgi:hypothetical protein
LLFLCACVRVVWLGGLGLAVLFCGGLACVSLPSGLRVFGLCSARWRAGLCGGRLCWCFACGVWLVLSLAVAAGLVRAVLGVAAGAGALARFLSVRAFLPALCVCVLLAVLGARRAACCCRCGSRVLWFGAGVVCVGWGAGVGRGVVRFCRCCLPCRLGLAGVSPGAAVLVLFVCAVRGCCCVGCVWCVLLLCSLRVRGSSRS